MSHSVSIYLGYEIERKVRDSSEPYGASKNEIEFDKEFSTYIYVKEKFHQVSSHKDVEALFPNADLPKKINEMN
ncbi:MAG: hypothetical protein Tsb0034_25400 [Ekhidna sp.]